MYYIWWLEILAGVLGLTLEEPVTRRSVKKKTLLRRLQSIYRPSTGKHLTNVFVLCHAKSNRVSRWKTLRLTLIINCIYKGTCLIFLVFSGSGCFSNCDEVCVCLGGGGGVKLKITACRLNLRILRGELARICSHEKDARMCLSGGERKETGKKTQRGVSRWSRTSVGFHFSFSFFLFSICTARFPFGCFYANGENYSDGKAK